MVESSPLGASFLPFRAFKFKNPSYLPPPHRSCAMRSLPKSLFFSFFFLRYWDGFSTPRVHNFLRFSRVLPSFLVVESSLTDHPPLNNFSPLSRFIVFSLSPLFVSWWMESSLGQTTTTSSDHLSMVTYSTHAFFPFPSFFPFLPVRKPFFDQP